MANKFMKKMYLRWKKLGVDEKQQYAQAITGTGQVRHCRTVRHCRVGQVD